MRRCPPGGKQNQSEGDGPAMAEYSRHVSSSGGGSWQRPGQAVEHLVVTGWPTYDQHVAAQILRRPPHVLANRVGLES